MNFSEYITEEKLEKDVLTGREKLPKELEYAFSPSLSMNNVTTYYFIVANTYGVTSTAAVNNWIVNNRLFFTKKDAEAFKTKMIEYNLEFGNIYEDGSYLQNKLMNIELNFNKLQFDHQSLYAIWLNEKSTTLSSIEYKKARDEYRNKIKSMLDTINKGLKEKRREEHGSEIRKIDYLTYAELCYIITFCRFHPDIFFIHNVRNFEVDYEVKDIQLFI